MEGGHSSSADFGDWGEPGAEELKPRLSSAKLYGLTISTNTVNCEVCIAKYYHQSKSSLCYGEQLEKLNKFNFERRRIRGYFIRLFKMIKQWDIRLNFNMDYGTRGHRAKLSKVNF